jgi:acetyl-CoA carboxylase carboxyltransferase component
MGSLSLGSDVNFAWPTAEIAVMGPEGAVRILYRREMEKSTDPEALYREKLREYREIFANPFRAAELGYIDDVIDIAETRRKIYEALTLLSGKRAELPPLRKHTNIPL